MMDGWNVEIREFDETKFYNGIGKAIENAIRQLKTRRAGRVSKTTTQSQCTASDVKSKPRIKEKQDQEQR